ncbi:MAG: damage-inducible protein CinA, partial [Flavobacteriales bacterium]|nr:damage-inducible protein CinA [Flavobacteriales bacterium]
MKVELITIGDEMLIGQIIDSNSAWMAQQLNDFGLAVVQITSIPDAKDHILKALELASKRADVILITGGLGPTKDDITKATLCTYFKTDLVLNEKVLKHVQAIFDSFGVPMQDVNKSQARVPANCEVISNRRGTAPGMWFNENGKIYVSMPGVPYEMKAMMTDYVIPKIQSTFSTPHIVHKTIRTQGLGESFLAERIADWENSLEQEGIKLAYLPSRGIVKLRLSTSGQRKSDLLEKVERKAEELKGFIGSYIFGYEDDLLEAVVGNLLTKQGKTISTA